MKKVILNIILVICIITACVTGFFLFKYYHDSHENEELVSSLKDMIDDSSDGTVEASGQEPLKVVIDEKEILKRYQKLYEKNKDFIGWIHIDGTKVDYPVMQCVEQEQKYLRKNFEGEYALAGTPFMAAACDVQKPSTTLVIYGHNMKDNTMFGGLDDFTDPEYANAHKTVRFDTIYGLGMYEVVAAFHMTLPKKVGDGYPFHTFIEADSQESLDEFVKAVNEKNENGMTFTATMEDHFLMLSTCDDVGAKDGRRVILIAKRVM